MAMVDLLVEQTPTVASVTIVLAIFSLVRRKTGGLIRPGQALKVLLLASTPVIALASYAVSGTKQMRPMSFLRTTKSCSVELSVIEQTDAMFVATLRVSSEGGQGGLLFWEYEGGETVTEVLDSGGGVVDFANGPGQFTLRAGSMVGNAPRFSNDGSFTDVGQAGRNWTGHWLSENRVSGTWGSPASSAPKPIKFVLNNRACSATVSGGRYGSA
jgi:hypothetical protein